MKLLYVFEERAPIFIELAWGISLSSASRLLAATILAGALAGSAMAQAPDAGCALPSEPEGIPAAIDAAITGPMDKDRACMKALLIPGARMMFVSLGTDGATTYRLETLDDWIARVKARGHALLEEVLRVIPSSVHPGRMERVFTVMLDHAYRE